MPGNAFIKFTATTGLILGESLQKSHPRDAGWTEISDWSFDVEAETNFLKGTGAAVGVATPGVFSFTHSFDRSSPVIMSKMVMGTAFNTVVVHMLKSTGATDGQPETYMGLKMTDGFITKVSSKGGSDGAISQDVDLVFKAIKIGYKRQANTSSGGGGAPGTLLAPMFFEWNVATKTNSTGIDLQLKSSD